MKTAVMSFRFSSATEDPFKDCLRSISVEFDYGKHEEKIKFMDNNHQKQIVRVTCETCVKTGKSFGSIQLELKTRKKLEIVQNTY
jgi:hypothetical protein